MRKEILFVILLLVSLFMVYQRSLHYDLIWDTDMLLHESFLLNQNVPLTAAFTTGYLYGQMGMQSQDFYYRPVLNLSFMLEKKTWGLRNVTLRLTNIFIFLFGVLMLFLFLRRQAEDPRFAPTVTLLFALSPLNVDNIVWVVGRGDLFLLLWAILTLLFFDFFMERKKPAFLWGVMVFFALGVFSKETFIFMWPVLLAFEWIKSRKLTWLVHLGNLLIIFSFFYVKTVVLEIASLGVVSGPPVFEYVKTALSVIGYYGRILLFPFFFEHFNFVNHVTNPFYMSLGIILFVGLGFLAAFSRHERKNWFPLVLLTISIIPYIGLAFSTLWPFRISARYMMLPFLAVIWLGTRYLCRLKLKLQNILVVACIVLFGSGIISGSSRFRSESDYWNNALESHPDSSFVLLQLGEWYFKQGDDFSSLRYFSEALRHPMAKTTAVGISLGMARIFFHRFDYQQASAWLNRVQFEILPYQRFQINNLRARMSMAMGNTSEAEKILRENITRFPEKREPAVLLYEMYLGFLKWDEAEKLENQMAVHVVSGKKPDIRETERLFNRFSPDQKIEFYIKYHNYPKALEIMNANGRTGFNDMLLRAELWYRLGNSGKGLDVINRILRDKANDFQVFNSIGFFYLKRMNRMNEAISVFRQSLKINPDQAGILKLVHFLQVEQEKLDKHVL